MRTVIRQFVWTAVVSILGVSTVRGTPILPILTLDPASGEISGAPGATVGWGFTLTNPDDTYLVVTSADFCGAIITSPCETPLGSFIDFIAMWNFTVVDPHSSASAVFDPSNLTGIGSYSFSLAAVNGDSFLGQIVLTYDLYASGPGIDLITTDNPLTAAALVTVSPLSTAEVPEPATLALVSSGLSAAYLARRRRRPRLA